MQHLFLRLLALVAIFTLTQCAAPPRTPQTPDKIARQILAPLLDPAKVATLRGDRPANHRLYKALYWLETARVGGGNVGKVISIAQAVDGYSGTPAAKADKRAIISNRKKLQNLGCLTPVGMAKLRKGGSPTITKGPHVGSAIALDHILPRSVVPELAARYFNLEAIDAPDNLAKSNKIGKRELKVARKWNREGLLSDQGLMAVEVVVK